MKLNELESKVWTLETAKQYLSTLTPAFKELRVDAILSGEIKSKGYAYSLVVRLEPIDDKEIDNSLLKKLIPNGVLQRNVYTVETKDGKLISFFLP